MTESMELKQRKGHKTADRAGEEAADSPDGTRVRQLSNELKDVDPERVPKIKGVKFAPLSRPLHRRLETAAVLWHTVTIPVFITLFFMMLAIPVFWIIMVPYIIYLVFDHSSSNGNVVSRYSEWFRGLDVWTQFCNFFPVRIHKTHDLEPTWTEIEVKDDVYKFLWFSWKKKPYLRKVATGPKYIFGLHPHGVVSLSGFGAVGTNGSNWSGIFPGIPTCLLTLINQFYIPLHREYLLALGITSANRGNALKILEQNYSIAIVVGGAQEALLARPDSNDIVLAKRQGFVKLALESENTGLVPCYCFGENDLYNILEPGDESFGKKLQFWLKKTFGFTLPFFHARGVFNYDFGLLPWRRQVTLVTGKPIMIPYKPDYTKVDIDNYHKLYMDALKELFDEYKEQYIPDGADVELNIVE
jgi:hypothetical protein